MLIGKTLNTAINVQIGNELGASNQYLQIAAWFDGEALPQLAAHFYKQADEERMHALKLFKYIETALEQELEVTRQINHLVDIAVSEKDHLAKGMLDWFVSEQLEEVASMDTLRRMIKRAGDTGLFHVESFLKDGGLAEGEGGGEG
jgi:ferritin